MTRPSITDFGAARTALAARAGRLRHAQEWSLPISVSLPLALAVSLALWAGLAFAVKALFF